MRKNKNIIFILILIVLSIFVVQYWSKQQEQVEKERLEQIEKERVEKTEQERLAGIEKEKAEQQRLAGIEKEKAEKKETSFTWHTDVNKAINISVKTGKPLFLFFTGSDWCGWCKKLVREVFVKPEFAAWATKNVILVELDFPRRTKLPEATQKQNRELGQIFGVRGYPTGWFVTPEITAGKVNLKKIGDRPQGYVAGGPKAWIAGANKILKTK